MNVKADQDNKKTRNFDYQTELVVLALDDNGIPDTVEKRLEIVRRLILMIRDGGLADEKVYIDPPLQKLYKCLSCWYYRQKKETLISICNKPGFNFV